MGKKLPRCSVRSCKRIARIGVWCKTHAVKEADRLLSIDVRTSGPCFASVPNSGWIGPDFDCAGPLQCAHLISRRYRATRWDFRNVVCACAAHHRWMDTNPLEKEEMMRAHLGDDYEPLRQRAMAGDWLPELAQALGIEPG